MHRQSSPHESKKRLMRRGFGVTGLGLAALLLGAGLLLEGQPVATVLLVALLCGGSALAVLGFGMMVAAADPFGEEEPEPYESVS